MAEFKASFLNELEKMYKKKKALLIIIISIVAIVLGQLVVTGIRGGIGARVTDSSEFPKLVLSIFANVILPLFTALVAIDIFSGEFSQNTMKIILTRPISRFKLFTSKVFAIAFFILVNLFIVMILSTLAGFIFNPTSVTLLKIFRILLSYAVTLLPILSAALIIVFFSNLFRSGTAVFFFSIILFIMFKVTGIIFQKYDSILITSLFSWYEHWNADTIPVSKLIREFLIMLGYGIMFFTAGFYMYDKKDI